MMKRTKKKIAISVIAVILVVIAIVLFFVLRKDEPVNVGDVTPTVAPTESVKEDIDATKEPTAAPTATEAPAVTEEPKPTKEAGTPVPTLDPSVEIPVEGDDVTPVPTDAPIDPDIIPAPTFAPTPTPEATATPKPTAKPTATPEPTATPKPTKLEADYFYEELARICSLDTEDAIEVLKEKGILPAYIDTKKVVREDAFVVLKNAYEYLNMPSDETMVSTVTKYSRLSDIDKLTDEEKAAAYYLFANGIVEGKSDGEFTRTRSFNPKGELSKEDAELYLGRLIYKEERKVLSPDGQITRKSDLRNMDLYPYILESIPDSFYTRAFEFMCIVDDFGNFLYDSGVSYSDQTRWKDGCGIYATPVMYRKLHGPYDSVSYRDRHEVFASVENEKKLETYVEEYLMKAFNVDYRTTPNDAEWKEYMYNVQSLDKSDEAKAEYCEIFLSSYLNLMKENKTIIECDKVYAEASTISMGMNGTTIRCYVHYRIKSFKSTKSERVNVPGKFTGYVNPLLFNASGTNLEHVYLEDVNEGEWRTGYFDIGLSGQALNAERFPLLLDVYFSDGENGFSITDY